MESLAFLIQIVTVTTHEVETDTLRPAMMHSPVPPLLWSFDMVSGVVRSLVDLMFSERCANRRQSKRRDAARCQSGWGGAI